MSAIDQVGASKAPISTRQAKKNKTEAARITAAHALSVFHEATQDLVIANALLDEAIAEDEQAAARLKARISEATAAREGNAVIISRLENLLSPAED